MATDWDYFKSVRIASDYIRPISMSMKSWDRLTPAERAKREADTESRADVLTRRKLAGEFEFPVSRTDQKS